MDYNASSGYQVTSPVSCDIIDETEIPDDYREERVEVKIQKSEAIRHYKHTGEILHGFRFYQKEHLRIK